jgi:Raf kinase inhibitor-like YbhB/YbcL family protein
MTRNSACLSLLLTTLLSGPALAAMTLTSDDIVSGNPIPSVHIYPRCGGRNISPQLSWSDAPGATKSFVLTMIDVDVKPSQWSHWLVVDLPVSVHSLSRGAASLPGGATAIVSNFGDAAYDGPCPPKGTGVHHYEFTIWALPTATTSLAPDEKANNVIDFLSRHALDRATLTALVEAPAH